MRWFESQLYTLAKTISSRINLHNNFIKEIYNNIIIIAIAMTFNIKQFQFLKEENFLTNLSNLVSENGRYNCINKLKIIN